ncbi:MAG: thiS [Geobacteraceae bacterium]|jgi:sulfur carrier protein|nr:thiS [Geobacteraceae bacterium]
MEIIVNGEKKSVDPMSLLHFLESLGIDQRRVAVELNAEILPKTEYEKTALKDGDRLEIVHFVGGG